MAGLPTVLIPNRFGGSGGASPPFAISDTTGLQTTLDGKLEDVADIAAAINCGQTAGTSTAVTAAKTGLVLSDGLLISVIWTTTNGAAPTLDVNGTGARAIKKHTQSGLAAISAAQLLGNFGTVVLVYNAADASWIVVSGLVMVDADLPATSNNSTISAISTVANAAIPNATVDAKGDLIVGTANDTVGRLAVGTNGQVLTADSAEATGLKFATLTNGVLPDAGTTSLSTTHYTATLASRPEPLTAGYTFIAKFNATNPASADIALSSGTAQPLYVNGVAAPAGVIVAGNAYVCRSNGTQVEIVGLLDSVTGVVAKTVNSANYELVRTANGWSLGVPTGKDVRIPVAGADQAVVGAAGLTLPTAQTAQFSSPSISNSSDSMRFGVATGYGFQWLQTNTSTYIADLTGSRGLVLYNSGSTFDSNQLSGSTSGPVINSTASLRVAISAGGPGTTNPEVCVYGISHTSSAGAIESKAGAVTRASNGTWTDIFDLSKGAYHGDFYLSDSLGDGHARYPISSTTLGTCVDNASGVTYVDAGSVGASNVGLRVNAGKLQINVGSSITASTKFALRFEGTVV